MVKAMVACWLMLGVVLAGGCGKTEDGPRFGGRVVSHVDAYGSGTGGEAKLDAEGSMKSGFEYGDASKTDWTSQIKWRFVSRDGAHDVYRLDWTFRLAGGTDVSDTKEVAFDGAQSVKGFSNERQVVSIEPGTIAGN